VGISPVQLCHLYWRSFPQLSTGWVKASLVQFCNLNFFTYYFQNSDGVTACGGDKYRWGIKITRFATNKALYILLLYSKCIHCNTSLSPVTCITVPLAYYLHTFVQAA